MNGPTSPQYFCRRHGCGAATATAGSCHGKPMITQGETRRVHGPARRPEGADAFNQMIENLFTANNGRVK